MTINTQYGDAPEDGMLAGTFDGTAQRQILVGESGVGAINYLYGEADELTDSAKAGNDVLIGGAGADNNALYGDAGYMTGSRGGNDVLIGGAGAKTNLLFGDAIYMTGSRGGNDLLIGGVGAQSGNLLAGDTGFMTGSQGGNDVLIGGALAANNVLFGEAEIMTGSRGGNDALIGGAGAQYNTLFGDASGMQDSEGGNDILTGGAGASTNFLYGDAEVHLSGLVTCGNDRLISDTGNDAMWGDIASSNDDYSQVSLDLSQVTTGKDVFVFSTNNGQDIIHDFRQGDNDKIELHQMGVLSFDALNSGDHLEEVMDTDTGNMNTVITFDSNTITILGVTGLTADDFLFS